MKTILQSHRRCCPALLLDNAFQEVLMGSQGLLPLLGPVETHKRLLHLELARWDV